MRTIGSPDLSVLSSAPSGQLSLADIEGARVLEPIVRQALVHPRRPNVEVVPMDEYSHDVVIELRSDLVLVFDTT